MGRRLKRDKQTRCRRASPIAVFNAKSAGTFRRPVFLPISAIFGRRNFAVSREFRGGFQVPFRPTTERKKSAKFVQKCCRKKSKLKNGLSLHGGGELRRFLSCLPASSAAWRRFGPRFGLRVPEMHTRGLSAFLLPLGILGILGRLGRIGQLVAGVALHDAVPYPTLPATLHDAY